FKWTLALIQCWGGAYPQGKSPGPGSLAAYPWEGAGRGSEPVLGRFLLPRSSLESLPDPAALSEKEGRLLLAALVKAYVQRKTNELEQEQEQEMEGSSLTAQKRSCNTATCVTHRLAGLLSRSGGVVKSNFVPTDVGSEAFGRRRRDLQA
uniref:Calcitonin peptide-like domain-containing protein n=1 Tax=Equus asinus asinus TaxID=83772 RepID=A0A8C4LAJ1_EQUAS